MPDLHAALNKIGAAWGTDQQDTVLKAIWPDLQNETIDYGVMERAEKVAVLPAGGLEWSDIGNWNSLFDVVLPDEHGNIVFGDHHLSYDTSNSLIYDKNDERLIVTIGVNDLIIVDTDDALLISRKDQSAKVKQIVNDLKNTDREYLT
jgi:mannose-1-phosphate guanylyltransferase